jgi:hypothetical protein
MSFLYSNLTCNPFFIETFGYVTVCIENSPYSMKRPEEIEKCPDNMVSIPPDPK